MSLDYNLDENKQLKLHLELDASGHLKARLYSEYDKQSELVKNLLPMMHIGGITPTTPEFEIPLPPKGKPIVLTINDEILGKFSITHNGIELEFDERTRNKLCVFETRIIGRSPQHAAPYKMRGENYEVMLKNTPLTDLHTHLSGQVSGDDLIKMGLDTRHEVLYPVAALRMLGIEPYNSKKPQEEYYKTDHLTAIKKRPFLPLAHMHNAGSDMEDAVPLSTLSVEALKTLCRGMSLSPEGQSTFEDLEKCYYLREPFTKDMRLLPDILRSVAKHYREQGIKYAELSSNAVLDPAIRRLDGTIEPSCLEIIHKVLPDIEKEFKVQLRFRAGLPRNLDEEALGKRIERYKVIAQSPYIVGPDVLGYEINKTSKMHGQLNDLAKWMKKHTPHDSLQIHAGENAKNLDNVREALELGKKRKIRLHIGHSLYGVDGETAILAMELAYRYRLLSQFNIDSNLALNNMDYPKNVPIKRFIETQFDGAPPSNIIASDGADIYGTSAKQTAMAAFICGVDANGFEEIRKAETTYIDRQKKIFDKKSKGFSETDFFKQIGIVDEKPPAPKASFVEAHTTEKTNTAESKRLRELISVGTGRKPQKRRPIFFAGAGGSSWQNISSDTQADFKNGIRELLENIDPEAFYFVKGRTKPKGGVNSVLAQAISDYNEHHEHKFECVTLLAKSERKTKLANQEHKSIVESSPQFHTSELSESLINLPSAVMTFLKERDGVAFFAGGNSFTRDFILVAKSKKFDIPFGIMENMNGASREKAEIYPQHAFTGAGGMIDYAEKMGITGKKKITLSGGKPVGAESAVGII